MHPLCKTKKWKWPVEVHSERGREQREKERETPCIRQTMSQEVKGLHALLLACQTFIPALLIWNED